MLGPSDGFGALIQASREEVQDKSPVKTREASQLAKGQPRQMGSRIQNSTHAPGTYASQLVQRVILILVRKSNKSPCGELRLRRPDA